MKIVETYLIPGVLESRSQQSEGLWCIVNVKSVLNTFCNFHQKPPIHYFNTLSFSNLFFPIGVISDSVCMLSVIRSGTCSQ